MLTNENVLEVFGDYLSKDTELEVVETHHGYTVLCWDEKCKNWLDSECCKTPYELLDMLLHSYESYLHHSITHSKRELTRQEEMEIRKMQEAIEQSVESIEM